MKTTSLIGLLLLAMACGKGGGGGASSSSRSTGTVSAGEESKLFLALKEKSQWSTHELLAEAYAQLGAKAGHGLRKMDTYFNVRCEKRTCTLTKKENL